MRHSGSSPLRLYCSSLFCECPKCCDLAKQRRKIFGGVSEVGKDDFSLYFCWRCVVFLVLYYSSAAIARHLTGDPVFLCCMSRPAVPVDQMCKMQASSDDDRLDPLRRKLSIRIHKRADLYNREKAEFGDLPRHQPGRDHHIRLNLEDNPAWVHPYKVDPSSSDELPRQLDKSYQFGQIRPCLSPYGAGCLLVKKANGNRRMCVNYQA